MSDLFRVTGIFCVAGNPTRAWTGSTGPNDKTNVPDDAWEDQEHRFDDLDAAKAWVARLHRQMSTHVAIDHSEDDGATWTRLVYLDADADHLADAAPGIVPPSERPPAPLPGENVVDETLTPYPPQEGDVK